MRLNQWLATGGCLAVMGFCSSTAFAAPSLEQCHGQKDLVFVAHQDDDLLFMNPDIETTIDAGGCVQTVYLTAAERGEGVKYMHGRARGVRAAYAHMADASNNWTETVTTFGGKHQARFTLNANPRVSLVHMRLEDPWLGKGWGSLTPLSRTESVPDTFAKALGPYRDRYNRADLVRTLAAIINDYQPTVIRHMDDSITVPYTALCWRCSGHDHPDHIASARLVVDAAQLAQGNYRQAAYVDYPTQERVANLTAAEIARKTDAFKLYARDDYRYCPIPALCKEPAGTAAAWVARTYYVVRRMQSPALVSSIAGGYLLFATGELNNATNVLRGSDQKWSTLGGRTAGGVAAFNWPDGQAGVLALDASGRLWANWQLSTHQWQGWQDLAGVQGVSVPIIINKAQGNPVALVLGNDGVFHYTAQLARLPGASANWSVLPRLAKAMPDAAMAFDANGRLAVFAADRKGRLWLALETRKDGTFAREWRQLAGVSTSGGLAAMRNADGKIELYARDKRSGHLLQMIQSGPASTGWGNPLDLGVTYIGRPGIAINEKGSVAVAALERAGGALWLFEGQSVVSLGEGVGSAPALRTINDTLYVVARSAETSQDYRVWARTQSGRQSVALLSAPIAAGGTSFASVSADKPVPAFLATPVVLSAGAVKKPATAAKVTASLAAVAPVAASVELAAAPADPSADSSD